ncbi:MAG: hypothetical protein Q8O04_12115, partial [Deltaproteobacteria bacterium]|nr:hypothetical protein [Deltaproteobacteria bacterium]
TGRSSKGMPYLRTLALSGNRIKETLAATRGGLVDTKFADRLTLKRFTTGCGWIADHPDPKERAAMWAYWRRHLHECLLPTLESRGLLAAWYRLVTATGDARTVYRLTRIATRITDALSLFDKLEARLAAKRH